ncbi:MAG: OBAP family protein [Burkholderiaceae bacterium]
MTSMRLQRIAAAVALLAAGAAAQAQGVAAPRPPGGAKTAKTHVLELGAKALQRKSPVAALDIHLDGFHSMKDDPSMQMEAHHFCHQVNQDFAQCVLFDGDGPDANLDGIEYIVSERLYRTLPDEEKPYWHPHDGEILSGQLVAPGIPSAAEHALMKDKMNSYGKTWHVWRTGMFGSPSDKLPLGPPMLAWSFSRDGEAMPGLVEQRDRRVGVDTARVRRGRADLVPLAHPQAGVDDLKGRYGRPTTDIPGVVDAASAPAAVGR